MFKLICWAIATLVAAVAIISFDLNHIQAMVLGGIFGFADLIVGAAIDGEM